MVSYGRPNVSFEEVDKTTIISDSGGRVAGVALLATWGPLEKVLLVPDVDTLHSYFGKPNLLNNEYYLNVQSILYYTNVVKVVRIATGHLNATSDGNGLLIKNREHYDSSFEAGQASVGAFTARYPGKKGNSLKVSVCSANSTAFSAWAYKDLFPKVPSTSTHASERGGSLDQIHVVVVDVNGEFSSSRNTVLEKWENLSLASDAKSDDGSVSYYKEVINSQSNYIYWTDHDALLTNAGQEASGTTFVTVTTPITITLAGGASDDAPTVTEIQTAYDIFANNTSESIYVLTAPPLPAGSEGLTLANYLLGIGSARKDCLVALSPPTVSVSNVSNATAFTAVTTFLDGLNSSKEGVSVTTSVKMVDAVNSKSKWVTSAGHLAGLLVSTPQAFDSPGGIESGAFRRVSEISFKPTLAQQDTIYNSRGNPVVAESGSGIFMNGDKTLYSPNTLFRKIDVRGLMIVLEKVITAYSKALLFKKNNASTASLFKIQVDSFLESVKTAEGISDFRVTTPVSTDPSTFLGDIYIKPITSINYVNLRFIATPTNVSFDEIVQA